MSENKPIGFLGDNLGDKSSKRLTSLILLFCSIGVALFALIFDAVKDGSPMNYQIYHHGVSRSLIACTRLDTRNSFLKTIKETIYDEQQTRTGTILS